MDKNTYLQYEEEILDGRISFDLNKNTDPLFKSISVKIPITEISSSLYPKTIVVYEGKISYGGEIIQDSLNVKIGKFGKYSIEVDSIPPTIEVNSFLKKAKGKPYFRFTIKDNYEVKGLAQDLKYDVYIDGKWVLAPLKSLKNSLIVPLDDIPSGSHTIKIRVEDDRKNVTTWTRGFTN